MVRRQAISSSPSVSIVFSLVASDAITILQNLSSIRILNIQKPTRDNGRRLYADSATIGHSPRRRLDCACEGKHSGINATGTAVEKAPGPANEDIVRGEDFAPHGPWNRVAREREVATWNSTGRRMMYGTIAVQLGIWRYQHPRSCRSKKFVVYKTSQNGSGMGAMLHKDHHYAASGPRPQLHPRLLPATRRAVHRRPVLPRHLHWTAATSNLSRRAPSATPCGSTSGRRSLARRFHDLAKLRKTLKDEYSRLHTAFSHSRSTLVVFHELLKQENNSKHSYYWWWGQGVAYLVRPNARTLKTLHHPGVEIFQNAGIEEGELSVHLSRSETGLGDPSGGTARKRVLGYMAKSLRLSL